MSEAQAVSKPRTPWHLWVIGVLSLLWNGMGAFDYLMTETQNESYMSRFTPEQLEFFYGFPAWIVALWAIAVWGGVLGSILLLVRSRFAAPTFLVALLAMVVVTIRNYVFAGGMAVSGSAGVLIFTAVIFLLSVFFWLYARAMSDRGVLT
jgi:hypothetical protein